MNKSNRIRNWQINVEITYYDKFSRNSFQPVLHGFLINLASVYKLDYAIAVSYEFPFEGDLSKLPLGKDTFDFLYFRSNEQTRIDKKEFRSAIDSVFHKVPSQLFEGVEVETQLYKYLKMFPFPSEFYRPLQYPFVEYYKDFQKKLLIYSDEVMKVIETEQNFPLN